MAPRNQPSSTPDKAAGGNGRGRLGRLVRMPDDSQATREDGPPAPPAGDGPPRSDRVRHQDGPSRGATERATGEGATPERDRPALDPLGPWLNALGGLRGQGREREDPDGGENATTDRVETGRPRTGRLRRDTGGADATTGRIRRDDRPPEPTPSRAERGRRGEDGGSGRTARDPRGADRAQGRPDRDRGGRGRLKPAGGGAAVGRAETAPRRPARRRAGRARRRPGTLFSPLAAVFGWLVAIGLGAILATLLGAVAVAIGLADPTTGPGAARAESSGVGAVAAVIAAVLLAYTAGGYVSGRLARARGGAQQGFAVWVLALLTAAILNALSAAAGQEFTLGERLGLPQVTVEGGAEKALAVTAAIVIGSLLAAVLGAVLGRRRRRRAETDR